ncbi:GntR family transcriptional regulator [Streptomyces sp. PT12]|uniref:GntR family transcriptional regulator n=1 Tax=Streptomyces sp. PT12 TaxID=1510197 RepID=UPI000DE1B406|nr:UTRA domain-containing protein [Streptomyces sp. PT12]RBM05659.1 UTRA domain-containing protein [Streptomyces sp. PT12]
MSGSEWVHTSSPYVRPREEGQRDAWTEETAAQGRAGTQRIVRAEEVEAPTDVAEALAITPGAIVVERRRVIYLDGEPTELTNTYYPVHIARGTRLSSTAKIPGGAVTLLATMGYVPHLVQEEVRARMPNDDERTMLTLGPHDPVLHLLRLTIGADGEPFQVDVSVFPASTQRLRYEMRVG